MKCNFETWERLVKRLPEIRTLLTLILVARLSFISICVRIFVAKNL